MGARRGLRRIRIYTSPRYPKITAAMMMMKGITMFHQLGSGPV